MRQNYINFPINNQTGLPSGATHVVDAFHQMHAIAWFYCFFILGMVLLLILNIGVQGHFQLRSFSKSIVKKKEPLVLVNPYQGYDNWLVESVLLFIPFIIVIALCIPSTALAYSTGEAHTPCASLKVTGEQWSWNNDLIVPVTKNHGYRLLDLNLLTQITRKYTELSNILTCSNIINETLIEQKAYYNFGLVYDQLYDPSIKHINWVNFQFTQTKVLPYDKYTNKTNSINNLSINNERLKLILNTHNLDLDNKGDIINTNLNKTTNLVDSDSLIIVNHLKNIFLNKDIIKSKQITPIMHDTTNIATAIPGMVWSKLIVDSVDVIHAYWLFEFGVKIDCIPGNPIQMYLFPKKFGISTGNCAEYCGGGHINMPITIKSYDTTQAIK